MAGLVAKVQDQATQLGALAHNDGLTGVPNRRAWELEMARVRRYGGRHGHQGGDRLLKVATAAWRTRMRRTDLLARYGGEEFAVLLHQPDRAGGGPTANAHRHRDPLGPDTRVG